ncbi:MAG: tyrosine--tRNA ligase [Bacteroidetes bacterium]|nr:tyrosine--tRNA ligase [Bacteroidota bacterium]
MDLFEEMKWRGLVYDSTPDLPERLKTEKVVAYVGFDPTAASLHVGSLLPIMCLARLQRFGHTPVALVGGGTGLIGDPSGKTKERMLLTPDKVAENLAGIRAQLEPFLDFASSNRAVMVNNHDWLGSMSLIEFLRDTGKHFTVNYMLAKESVKRRLESEDGISYTEFSYMLLQAYDFSVLNRQYDCTLQMGGSDQWGNIVAGAELIRKTTGGKASGLVFPLVTNSAGTKFGKTESGTVWLDPKLTSPYRFYQFWINTDDRDVIPYLKYFTWLTREEIESLEDAMRTDPGARAPQTRLAEEITAMVHGSDELERAKQATAVLFGGSLESLSATDLLEIFEEVPSSEVGPAEFADGGVGVIDLFANAGLAASKGEARRLLRGGGLRINNVVVSEEDQRVTMDDAIDGKVFVLRKGRKHYHVVQIR